MDNKGLILMGVVWFLFNLFARKKRPPARPTDQPRPTPGTARPLPRPMKIDATQREGSQLELLLRQLGRTLDQAGGPLGRLPDRPIPPAAEQEERESLEVMPVSRSLETDVARSSRVTVDQDDEAERVIARRVADAENRIGGRTKADHLAFDQRIRQQPADKTSTSGYTARKLRQAVVWREILDPPVSLRDSVDP
ncbi:MAG TPA: hypothetical protein VHR41_06030 [Gemmatimonadales bacterium]|jgi:hypothetical protein|nr:hypothetical protein [Gemmatimonadales bacterium]